MRPDTGEGLLHRRHDLATKRMLYGGLGAIALLASACALTTEHVDLSYTSQSGSAQVAGASEVGVRVEVTDKRPSADVGRKKNGYGVEMAPIVADTNIAGLVKNAIETELRNRGFAPGNGPIVVAAELSSFKNTFEVGFFSGTAKADLAMNVLVIGPDQKVVFKKWIMAQGLNPGVQLATGNNAKIALEAALRNAMTQLFADQDFLHALASGASAPAAAGARVPALQGRRPRLSLEFLHLA